MKITAILKRYRMFIAAAAAIGVLTLINNQTGLKAITVSMSTIKQMLLFLPAIFLLLGLLDVWVPRETVIKYMGEGSGLKGILLSFLIGSAAAGPLYGAFPVAAVFMKKGVKFSNILIFIGAWSTTKIPMMIFEATSLGARFALARLAVNIPGIIIMAWLLQKNISENEIKQIYEKAEMLGK